MPIRLKENMKTRLATLISVLPFITAAYGAPVLLGGYHGGNDSPNALQSPSISGISVTLVRTGTSMDITQGFSQIAATTWGTATLDVPAPTQTTPLAIFQGGTVPPITLILTITNNSGSDLLLDSIHYNIKKDINNVGPPSGSITYTSGDLADADGTSLAVTIPNGVTYHDYALSSFLTDTTLANGESAVFTWTHNTPQDPSGNHSLRMDNLAISGELVTGGPDTNPPTPNPMTWASVPTATGDSSITMTATLANDPSGVEYRFTRYAADGTTLLYTSPWQDSREYTDTGLNSNTTYNYTVQARDKASTPNEGSPSTPVASATTDAVDNAAPTPNPMTWASVPTAVNDSSITMTATTASDPSGVEYRFIRYAADGTTLLLTSPWQDSTVFTDTGLNPETTYNYTVQARDKASTPNVGDPSTPVASATTSPTPVGPVLLGGFDGSNAINAPKQHPSAIGIVSMSLDTSLDPSGLNPGNFMQSSSPLWGTTDLDPDAQNTTTHNCVLSKNGPYDLFITVTNTSTDKDVTLKTLHWRSKRDTTSSDTHATITYVSGSLTDSLGTNTEFYLGGLGAIGHEFPLSNMMADYVLGPGETATFSWSIESGGNVRWDNIAISGTISDSDYYNWGTAQNWTFGAPGTGVGEDFDHDGLSNDMERMFGLDPTDASSANPYTTPFNAATGTFSYKRRSRSITGLNFPVWFSTDLQEWYRDIYATETPGTPLGDVEIVGVQINPVLLSQPRLFVQLRPEPPLVLPAPELLNLTGSNNTITINFTRELYQLTATDTSNYTVQLDGGGTVTVTDASLSEDGKSVTLTLNTSLSLASTYNVSFSNLTGVTGVPLAGSGSGQFETWDDDPNGVKVFILAGQSNMVGYGQSETGAGGVAGAIGSLRYLANNNSTYTEYDYTSLLDNPADPVNSAWATRSDVKVWWRADYSGNANLGATTIRKGNLGPPFQGKDTPLFGPEYAFGRILAEHYASNDVLIIKTAWGGKSLGVDFRPPSAVADRGGVVGPYYEEIIKNVREVLTNLGTQFPEWNDGRGYQIVGIGWHQGWNDGGEPLASEYKDNLPDLISDLRAEFGKPDLPFVIATTGMGGSKPVQAYPYPDYSKVEKAQLWVAGVTQPANVRSTDTRGFWEPGEESPTPSQGYHWNHNARSYFRVGKALGDDMVNLLAP